jgi:DNA-binding MarR family transcriptional regulator
MSKEISEVNLCRMLNGVAENLREAWLKAQSSGHQQEIMTLTVSQHRLLRMVWLMTSRCSQGVMLKELAERLGLSSSAVSVMVDNLVRRGILRRIVQPDDRRKVMISLSAAQMELIYNAECGLGSLINEFKEQCPSDKMRCFEEVLSELDNFLINKGTCNK